MNQLCKILVVAAVLAGHAGASQAATLRCRTEARPQGAVVQLKDVVEVFAAEPADAERLGALELFPAPATGDKRHLRVRELQDMLLVRGVNLLEIEFAGASQIMVWGPDANAKLVATKPAAGIGAAPARQASAAATKYLRELTNNPAIEATVELTEAQNKLVAEARGGLQVSGNAPQRGGPHALTLHLATASGQTGILVQADVRLPAMVVATVRNLNRGAVVRAEDVELQPARSMVRDDMFTTLGDVIGKEVVRPAAPGQILDSQYVRRSLLVRKGEAVTVYAKSAGIQVRTTGRAKEDGAQGDLVTIESTLDRATFFARVSGVQQVEIFAHSATVGPTSTTAPSPAAAGSASAPVAAQQNFSTLSR